MTQPLTWSRTPIPEMDFGLSIQESHGFSRAECQLVFLCDSWKTAASFSLCGMTSNLVFLKRKLITMLRNNVIEGEAEQIWKAETIRELNDCVVYAYIQAVRNGEFNTDGCGL